ncbi:MAG: lipopolysaccharide biosynthesis [Bryobacterales bacterium]|nr:lipopolysaccharide biosynthesis [Bryobacterales bacterium]
MADFFEPIEYLAYLGRNWKFVAIAIGTAVGLTAAASFLLPNQYTATATLVIEPPSGMDPRGATAVSAIYLESLKTYEQFAASDSLFERARQKFHLADDPGSAATETLRRRVLRVTKLPDTKVLQIRATLRDPKQAQALVQFLAEETVALNRSVENQSEREALMEVRKQVEDTGAKLAQSREQFNAVAAGGAELVLADEVRDLSDLKGRLNEQLAQAGTSLAEFSARAGVQTNEFARADSRENLQQEIAGARARGTALVGQIATVNRDLTQKAAALATARARTDQSADQLRAATAAFEAMSRRANELAGSSGLRSEQLRIIDPGIVPQQPSFPNIPLFTGAALLISAMLCLAWLSLRYGLDRQRARTPRFEFKVARSGGR